MPFGISIAPFVAQKLLNSVVAYIRTFTAYVWDHTDDVLISHPSRQILIELVALLQEKLRLAGWLLNFKKSVLTPVKQLFFLGGI